MEKLNCKQKYSVLRVLREIVVADNVVKECEVNCMNEIARSFGISDHYDEELNQVSLEEATSIIGVLPPETKKKVAQLMGRMIVVDKDINYNEVKLYKDICNTCGIHEEFLMSDYPECSLSGPFANPEDLMERPQ